MTRFARAKGSKASNERKEEDPTPWHIMRQQLAEQFYKNDDDCGKKSSFECNTPDMVVSNSKEEEEVWSEFNEFELKKLNVLSSIKSKTFEGLTKRQSEKTCKDKINKIRANSISNSNCLSKTKEAPVKLCSRPCQSMDELVDCKITDSKKTIQKGHLINNPIVKSKLKHNKTNSGNSNLPYNKNTIVEVSEDLRSNNRVKNNSKTNEECNSKKMKTNKFKTLENANAEQQETRLPAMAPVNLKTSNSIRHTSKNGKKEVSSQVKNDKRCYKKEVHINSNKTSHSTVQTIIANGREIEIVKFEAFWIKKDDATKLKELRKKLRDQKMSKVKIKAIIKLERRKAEKALSREKTNVCYNCRQFGHKFSECPEINDSTMSKSGICFKCGSTEHTHFECKVTHSQNFRYAVCFICNEQGHIARQCSLNPQGQYPKGGSCHLCGEITHLRKDCPKAFEEKPSSFVTVEKINSVGLEDVTETKINAKKQSLVKHKVVLF